MYIKIIGFMCLSLVQLSRASDVTINSYRLDPETDLEFYNPGTLRVTKKSRNLLLITGSWDLFQNIGENVQFVNIVLRKNLVTGRYQKIMEQKLTFCDFVNKDTLIVPKIREVSNIPEPGTCPLPKGRFTINDYKFELPEALPLPPGDYLIVGRLVKDGQLKMGLEWSITVQK